MKQKGNRDVQQKASWMVIRRIKRRGKKRRMMMIVLYEAVKELRNAD